MFQNFLKKYLSQIILCFLAIAFVTRVERLHLPEKYMFDEVYHAVTAKLISRNDVRAYEWWNEPVEPNTAVDWLHPPLAKYFQAISMLLLSENSFAWRFSSAIFGVICIYLVAILSLELFEDKQVAFFATLTALCSGLMLALSRIAMNDMHVTTFIVATIYFYTKFLNSQRKNLKFLLLSIIFSGFAISTKWSGIFVIAGIAVFEIFSFIKVIIAYFSTNKNSKIDFKTLKTNFFGLIKIGLGFATIPPIIYFLSYSHMFLQGKDINHLVEMHNQIWWYQTNLKANHPAESRPFDWFFNLNPVWFHVDYSKENMRADIYATENPVIPFVFMLAIFFAFAKLFHDKKNDSKTEKIMLIFCLTLYFIVWLPWIFSPRIMFMYHYLPAVPFGSILVGYMMANIRKELAFFLSILIITGFIFIYPQVTGIHLDNKIKKDYYSETLNKKMLDYVINSSTLETAP